LIRINRLEETNEIMRPRVLLLGLDGARLDVLQKWCGQGFLPHIKTLIEQGTSGTLKTILPIHSFPAWTSMSTGCNPTTHGIYDILLRRKTGSYSRIPPNSNYVKVKRFWQILDEQGYHCAAINIPASYPPTQLKHGITVSSVLTPSISHVFAHPEPIVEMLRKQKYQFLPQAPPGSEEYIKQAHEILEKQYRLVTWFMDTFDWDCVFWVVMSTEILHHHYAPFVNPDHPFYNPDFEEIVRNLYIKIDTFIGNLLQDHGDDLTIFLVSDHGFSSYYGTIYMNALLKKWGFLKTKSKVNLLKYRFMNASKKIGKYLYPILPRRIKEKAIAVTGFGAVEFSLDLIDWSKTKAYVSMLDGQINLNLKGREKHGVVTIDEYDTVVNDIIKRLHNESKLKGLIDQVYRKSDLYDNGQFYDLAPDIYLLFKDANKRPYKIRTNPFHRKIIDFDLEQFKENVGYHTLHGTFIAHGKNIKRNNQRNAEIIDIAPTILSLFEIDKPHYQEGIVLEDIFLDTTQEQNENIVEKSTQDT